MLDCDLSDSCLQQLFVSDTSLLAFQIQPLSWGCRALQVSSFQGDIHLTSIEQRSLGRRCLCRRCFQKCACELHARSGMLKIRRAFAPP